MDYNSFKKRINDKINKEWGQKYKLEVDVKPYVMSLSSVMYLYVWEKT